MRSSSRVLLDQSKLDIRKVPREAVKDFAVYDGGPVRCRAEAYNLPLFPPEALHGEQHSVLLVKNTLCAVQVIAPDGGRCQLPPVTQEKGKAVGAFPLPEKLAERGLGDSEMSGSPRQVSELGDGDKVAKLSGIHVHLLLF